jgi:hypothetical protein
MRRLTKCPIAVDHQGVPNAQLIKENVAIAAVYNNKSIAEQNSLDIGALSEGTVSTGSSFPCSCHASLSTLVRFQLGSC